MAAIRSRDTKPEIYVRRALHAAGFRFRLHRRDIPGNPDIVLPRFRVAVQVHGCFWHGHDCRLSHQPKTNRPYWSAKIARNVERDRTSRQRLEGDGWTVVTIWECALESETNALISHLTRLREQQ